MGRSWAVVVALLGGRLALPVVGSREFEIPNTIEELREQLQFFENELYGQENGCKSNLKPFLLHYDVDEDTGVKTPVCISEEELLRRRLDENTCNTKVVRGKEIAGGCSQYNYMRRDGTFINSPDDDDDYVVFPMHRNVPFHHGNTDNSPNVNTVQYYTKTKFLPCSMHSSVNENQLKSADLDAEGQQGYCDVDPDVKERLCWTGTSASADKVTQSEMLDGTFYNSDLLCDVNQHFTFQHAASGNNVVRTFKSSFHATKPKDTNLALALQAKTNAQDTSNLDSEATIQSCSKWKVMNITDLEQESYYTGNKYSNSFDYFWRSQEFENMDKCVEAYVENKQNCIIKQEGIVERGEDGSICYSDKNPGCDVHNVWAYSSSRLEHCFRKDIHRPSEASGDPTFTRRDTNYMFYYNATKNAKDMSGNNACDTTNTFNACKQNCYERCKAMKFPAFSVLKNQANGKCMCSDFSMSVCPESQKRDGNQDGNRVSFDITPRCNSPQCDSKTKYSDKLRPCQFTEEYRTQKCTEVCAAEESLFMTTTESGVCLCSKMKRGDTNEVIDLENGDACPWSTASRVYMDTNIKETPVSGYLGDSFVTNRPLKSYQLHYSAYYEDDQTPADGIVVCKKGSPLEEIYEWYEEVTGNNFEDSVTVDELKKQFKS